MYIYACTCITWFAWDLPPTGLMEAKANTTSPLYPGTHIYISLFTLQSWNEFFLQQLPPPHPPPPQNNCFQKNVGNSIEMRRKHEMRKNCFSIKNFIFDNPPPPNTLGIKNQNKRIVDIFDIDSHFPYLLSGETSHPPTHTTFGIKNQNKEWRIY